MSRTRDLVLLVLLDLLAGVCACRSQDTAPERVQGEQPRAVVPALPPESVPARVWADIHAPGNIIRSSPHWSAPFPRDLLLVMFKEDASQAERQAAVDSIGGEVVGGEPLGQGGYYYVRIAGDSTGEALFRAIAKLMTLRQIDLASPELPAIQPL